VFQWLKREGGLVEIERKNYDFLDASRFFKSRVRKPDRSRMNNLTANYRLKSA